MGLRRKRRRQQQRRGEARRRQVAPVTAAPRTSAAARRQARCKSRQPRFPGLVLPRAAQSEAAPGITILADFSANLMRDLAVSEGQKLSIALPPKSLRLFATRLT